MRRFSFTLLASTLLAGGAFAQTGQPAGATITIIPPTAPTAATAPTVTPPAQPKLPQPGGASMVGGSLMEHPNVLQPGTPQATPVAAAPSAADSTATADQRFNEMDTNHDGVVTRQELIEGASQHFNLMDGNHDGNITKAEAEASFGIQAAPQAQAVPAGAAGAAPTSTTPATALPPAAQQGTPTVPSSAPTTPSTGGLPVQPPVPGKMPQHY